MRRDKTMTFKFTASEAMRAQRALRDAAGLPERSYTMDRFIGLVSDEIDALWAMNITDDEITALISKATGKLVTEIDIAEFYAPADRRFG